MAVRGSIKSPPDPSRNILLEFKQSELLRMVDRAAAAGVSTHEWAQKALLEAAR